MSLSAFELAHPSNSLARPARLDGYPSFAHFIARDADASIYRKYAHLSAARSMSSLPVRSGGKGAAGHSVLRSNSRRVRGVSHCRDKLSQNQLGVLCRCCFSSFRRSEMGGEESVVGSA